MADTALASMSAASALGGTELVYGTQGGGDVKITAAQIKTLAIGAGSVSVASGKTLTASNTLTLTATDGSTLAIGTGGTLGTAAYTASSAYLAVANNLSDLNSAGTARTNLGLGSIATQAASAVAITGGTVAGLTGLAIRDTSAAFDLTLAGTSSAALTAGRTLTLDMGNVAHTVAFGTTANTITFPNAPSGTVPLLNLAQTWTANQTIASANNITWNGDTTLSRFGAGILGLSNSTTITEWQQYATTDSTTSPTNYARAVSRFSNSGAAADTWLIGTEKGGTGTSPSKMDIFSAGSRIADYGNSNANGWTFQIGSGSGGNFYINRTSANGPPTLIFQSSGTTKALFGAAVSTGDIITGTAAGDFALRVQSGNFYFSNDGGTTANWSLTASLFRVGGTTSSFPALKRSSATLSVRLADDSGDADILARTVRGVAVTFANVPASPVEGMLVAVTDSTTNTWGATITGSGANHVLAYYNGTNWTVAGK